MANQKQLNILKKSVKAWNEWRSQYPDIRPNLEEANLTGLDLRGAILHETNLRNANLSSTHIRRAAGANLERAILIEADLADGDLASANFRKADLRKADLRKTELTNAILEEANLSGAKIRGANLKRAILRKATLIEADFSGSLAFGRYFIAHESYAAVLEEADLTEANLTRANLTGVNLNGAILNRANLTEAILNNCWVHGVAVWDVQLQGAIQLNLDITLANQAIITIDNLEVAQFIYLLLNNQNIRHVIDTVTSKVVLILGRFTFERKTVLNAIRNELRQCNYVPVLFDFDKPASRDLTETISTLAHMARFIIADLSDPNSIPHEVATIIPQCKVPLQPLLTLEPLVVDGKEVERREYPMFRDLQLYPWVLPTFRYQNQENLLLSLKEFIIQRAEEKAKELEKLKK